jgi:hypothetical protein
VHELALDEPEKLVVRRWHKGALPPRRAVAVVRFRYPTMTMHEQRALCAAPFLDLQIDGAARDRRRELQIDGAADRRSCESIWSRGRRRRSGGVSREAESSRGILLASAASRGSGGGGDLAG